MDSALLRQHADKMALAGMPAAAIKNFERAMTHVAAGGETLVAESAIEPVEALPSLEETREHEAVGRRAMAQAAMIKLNGGLGTSMGLSKAKSLLEVREGATFLDLIAQQVLAQRAEYGVALPFLLMNSYRTRADSLSALSAYPTLTEYPELDRLAETACAPQLAGGLPLDFLQHRVPRIDLENRAPVEWSEDPELEWCPPGHGDLYLAMQASGTLDRLLACGIRYAFVSNADNLGAVLDPAILGWVVASRLPFAMEVAERTAADRKGGHLARRNGQLTLREVAQCPEEDRAAFEDVDRHRFFNTNNLWLDLEALGRVFGEDPLGPRLPIISNLKNVSPSAASSPRCQQLETAMGAAIECFAGAGALVVPRDRFSPVKTTNDLLAVRSDAYTLTPDHRLVEVAGSGVGDRVIDLDPAYYGTIPKLEARFPKGPPSLVKCARFAVSGDHEFGGGVVVEGDAHLSNEAAGTVMIPDGMVLGESGVSD